MKKLPTTAPKATAHATTTAPHVTKMLALNKIAASAVADEANAFIEVHCYDADYDLCKKIVGMYANVEFFVVPAKAVSPSPVSSPAKKAPMQKPLAAVVPAAPKKAARITPGGPKVGTVANVITLLQKMDLTCDNVELSADEKTVLVVLPANELVEAGDLIANARYENVSLQSVQTVAKQKAILATKKVPTKPAAKTQPAPQPTNAKPVAAPVPALAKAPLLKISKSADWEKIYALFPDQTNGKREFKTVSAQLLATGTLIGKTKKTDDRLFISDGNAVYFESKSDFLFDCTPAFRSPAAATKFVEKVLTLLTA